MGPDRVAAANEQRPLAIHDTWIDVPSGATLHRRSTVRWVAATPSSTDVNVRGLLAAVGSAAREAVRRETDAAYGRDLAPDTVGSVEPMGKATRGPTPCDEDRGAKMRAFRAALAKHSGDVARAAVEVGVSRATGCRWAGGRCGLPFTVDYG